jgi:hypothetical protein
MGSYDNLEEWMAKSMGPNVKAPSSTYRDTVRAELAALLAASVVTPSGDTTGVTDLANIQEAIDTYGFADLSAGDFYINDSIVLSDWFTGIRGVGKATRIQPEASVASDFPLIYVGGSSKRQDSTISGLYLTGGEYCIQIEDCSGVLVQDVYGRAASSHGIYLSRGDDTYGAYIVTLLGCQVAACGGDGVNAVCPSSGLDTGNALALFGCNLEGNTGNGLTWSATGLYVHGCTIEGNEASGIQITATNCQCQNFDIRGNYFELNGTEEIRLTANATYLVNSGIIGGNRLQAQAGTPAIRFEVTDGIGYNRIVNVTVEPNYYGGSGSTTKLIVGNTPYRCIFEDLSYSDHDMDAARLANNKTYAFEKREVVTTTFAVACNVDKTDALPLLLTLPAGSIIHNIMAWTTTAFNGTGTKTFEVGVATNPDNYIDTSDLDVSTKDTKAAMIGGTNNDQKTEEYLIANTAIYAKWTNTGGTPSAGAVRVAITYSQDPGFYVQNVAVPS